MFGWLFDSTNYSPHGFCLAWEPDLLIWTLLGDALTCLAYFWIPIQLGRAAWHLGRGGRLGLSDQPWVLGLFATFILLCGATHAVHVTELFVPMYRFGALLTLITGITSVTTAALLQWVFRPAVSEHDYVNLQQQHDDLIFQYRKLAAGTTSPEMAAAVVKNLPGEA